MVRSGSFKNAMNYVRKFAPENRDVVWLYAVFLNDLKDHPQSTWARSIILSFTSRSKTESTHRILDEA